MERVRFGQQQQQQQPGVRGRKEKMVAALKGYAENETEGVKKCVMGFANGMHEVNMEATKLAQRVDDKVFGTLLTYKESMKAAKRLLKEREEATSRYRKTKAKYDDANLKQRDPNKIRTLGGEIHGLTNEVMQANKRLNEEMLKMEDQKVKDLEKMLSEYMHAEIAYHAKAIEIYTASYQGLFELDNDLDIKPMSELLVPAAGSIEAALTAAAATKAAQQQAAGVSTPGSVATTPGVATPGSVATPGGAGSLTHTPTTTANNNHVLNSSMPSNITTGTTTVLTR